MKLLNVKSFVVGVLLTKIIFTKSFHYVVVILIFIFAGFTYLWSWKGEKLVSLLKREQQVAFVKQLKGAYSGKTSNCPTRPQLLSPL